MIKLNVGCGCRKFGDYINLDIDPIWEPDILCDIRKLSYEDNFADEIYSSHVLEHFYDRECNFILQEWKRVLKIGGLLDTIVPDVGLAAIRFSRGELSEPEFLERLIGADQCQTPYMVHLNYFWEQRLRRILTFNGFINIIRVPSDVNPIDLRLQARK